MKKMNLIKSGILSLVGSIMISAPVANAGEGYNLLFDANKQNNGQPLNYNNSGCLIYTANEQMGRQSMASYAYGAGTFYATGNEQACANVCRGWNRSFTTDPGPYYWETKHMYVYPKGFPVSYYIPGADYTANFVCKTDYSAYYGSQDAPCFQPHIDHDPKKPIPPYVFLTHDSEYAYCNLK